MKIVMIVSRFPYPLEKGDKLRAFQHLSYLNQAGHEVYLIALSDENVSEQSKAKIQSLCASVQIIKLSFLNRVMNLVFSFFSGLPLQVGYFYSKSIHKLIDKTIQQIQPELIYCQLIRTALYKKNFESIPGIIDYMDAFSIGTAQRLKNAPTILKPVFKRELAKVKSFEMGSFKWFKSHLIISDQDRKNMSVPDAASVRVIPNGVDTDFFQPANVPKSIDITFVGNMNYPPNIDAAIFLVRDIMPVVWKSKPEITVQLAGANPHASVAALASEKVKVTGWVNDIRDCYHISRIFVAPMRIGTGLQNKLLEAMAVKLPCITTSISFTPLHADAQKDILVGNTKEELAGHILFLLQNPDKAEIIARSGFDFVTGRYSIKHSFQTLGTVFTKMV
ncbi:MAG: glycosyltransferase [Bacteroidetes bacterium]|nr:glycosyltransferase [Bacteroidota bacterium]